MRLWTLLLVAIALGGCNLGTRSGEHVDGLTAQQRTEVEDGARRFMARVAEDVTREGPAAWRNEFADRPEFFMASNGQLAFASGQAALQGIEGVAKMIKHIELHWGDDLRVDALTPELAMVGTTWKEVRVDAEGHEVKDGGYFTGLVERRNGLWQFRNVHWSEPVGGGK